MEHEYERIKLTITFFDKEDVIVTSEIGRNNAYESINDLGGSSGRMPSTPGPWY